MNLCVYSWNSGIKVNLNKVGKEVILSVFPSRIIRLIVLSPDIHLFIVICTTELHKWFAIKTCHKNILWCCITAVIMSLRAPTEIVWIIQQGVFKCFKINLQYYSFNELGWQLQWMVNLPKGNLYYHLHKKITFKLMHLSGDSGNSRIS